MKNWKLFVEKKNAKTFVLPDGWDSRDEVAQQLDCSTDKVDDHLRPALKSGEVIKQQFKVWDDGQKRLVFVVAYREASKEKAVAIPASEFDLARAQAMKTAGKSYAEIGAALGTTKDAVRNKLRRAG
jgi:DNA-binding CsgD family transcriptional regulator